MYPPSMGLGLLSSTSLVLGLSPEALMANPLLRLLAIIKRKGRHNMGNSLSPTKRGGFLLGKWLKKKKKKTLHSQRLWLQSKLYCLQLQFPVDIVCSLFEHIVSTVSFFWLTAALKNLWISHATCNLALSMGSTCQFYTCIF